MEYTPGPWKFVWEYRGGEEEEFGAYFIVSKNDHTVAVLDMNYYGGVPRKERLWKNPNPKGIDILLPELDFHAEHPEAKANAQLISATPQLYEACLYALNTIRQAELGAQISFIAAINLLKQVIAKAKGKENEMECLTPYHHFEPRYDEKINEKVLELAIKMWPEIGDLLPHEFIEMLRDKTYIGDICPHCGLTKSAR